MRRKTIPKKLVGGVVVGVALAAGAVYVSYLIERKFDADAEHRVDVFRDRIWQHSRTNALPPELVRAVIKAESAGDPRAVSPKNAKGLMQITPIAEREVLERTDIAKGDLFDPDYNIRIGTTYLRMLVNRFEGDVYLAVAAYNMGPTGLQKLRDKYPKLSSRDLVQRYAPRETARYCRDILGDKTPRLPVTKKES